MFICAHILPIHLFKWGILEQKKNSLVCHYKTQEPMSYIKNPYFMTQNVSIIKKIEYIQMLSMRRISEKQDYITKKYIKKELQNPFIQIKEDKIYFTQESSHTRNT